MVAPVATQERLQKVMADAGVGSRRHCEQMIREHLVEVNGQIVEGLPFFVDPAKDRIVVGGRRLRAERKVYYLLHKPRRVVCTNSDPAGRIRASDLLSDVKQRIFPVGRLDVDSKGALILTNDGELANQLTHPRYGVPKIYMAIVKGKVKGESIDQLRKGIWLSDGKARIENVRIAKRGTKYTHLEITLREGRNRQIRRMLSHIGHPVKELTRTHIGKLSIQGLGPRNYRPLTPREISGLIRLCRRPESRPAASGRQAKKHMKRKRS